LIGFLIVKPATEIEITSSLVLSRTVSAGMKDPQAGRKHREELSGDCGRSAALWDVSATRSKNGGADRITRITRFPKFSSFHQFQDPALHVELLFSEDYECTEFAVRELQGTEELEHKPTMTYRSTALLWQRTM